MGGLFFFFAEKVKFSHTILLILPLFVFGRIQQLTEFLQLTLFLVALWIVLLSQKKSGLHLQWLFLLFAFLLLLETIPGPVAPWSVLSISVMLLLSIFSFKGLSCKVLLLISAFLQLIAVADYVWVEFNHPEKWHELTGLFNQENLCQFYFMATLFIGAYLLASGRVLGKWKTLSWSVSVAALSLILFSGSRSIQFSMLLATGITLLIGVQKKRRQVRLGVWAGLSVILVLILSSSAMTRFLESSSWWARPYLYQVALNAGAENLFVGQGTGSFATVAWEYRPSDRGLAAPFEGIITHPHSYHLLLFAENGLPGFLLILFLAGWPLFHFGRKLFRYGRKPDFIAFWGVLSFFIAVNITAVTAFFSGRVLYWFVLLWAWQKIDKGIFRLPSRFFSSFRLLLILFLFLLLLPFSQLLHQVQADSVMIPFHGLRSTDGKRDLPEILLALEKDSKNYEATVRLAHLYAGSGDTKKALRMLKAVDTLYGRSERVSMLQADLLCKEKRWSECEQAATGILQRRFRFNNQVFLWKLQALAGMGRCADFRQFRSEAAGFLDCVEKSGNAELKKKNETCREFLSMSCHE